MDSLRRGFADITAGYSRGTILGRQGFAKHLSYTDQIEYDSKRDEYYREAKSNGIPNVEEKLKNLRASGEWTDAKEREIEDQRRFVEGLREGIKKHTKMPSMVQKLNVQLKDEEKKLEKSLAAKFELLGLTCESYADRQINDYYIYTNLFSDAGLTVPLFAMDEFDYFTDPQLGVLIQDYNVTLEPCSVDSIKRLAMQPFFQEYFCLAGEHLEAFFGGAIARLTFSQVKLLAYGQQFRHIYQTHETKDWPPNVLQDPDLMLDYAVSTSRGKEEMARQGVNEQGAVVVGMKKEDSKALGVKTQNNLGAEIAKHGGNLVEWASKRG
jgi:hypothetical protein